MTPEIYRMITYMLVTSILCPSFSSFSYFFLLDVVEISKFTYALLNFLGYICLFVGVILYKNCLYEFEYRMLFLIAIIIGLTLAPISFTYVMRWNVSWGIPDLALIIPCEILGDIATDALTLMPMAIMMIRICPKHIEASTLALLYGVHNFRGVISGFVGSIVNDLFVGVS